VDFIMLYIDSADII